jgi:predicted transcriptional regulator
MQTRQAADRHTKPITAVRLRPEIREALDRLAKEHDVSISWLVNVACAEFVSADTITLDIAEIAL